eukprot:1244207-Pleurochrysis_carterae.AAC.1
MPRNVKRSRRNARLPRSCENLFQNPSEQFHKKANRLETETGMLVESSWDRVLHCIARSKKW